MKALTILIGTVSGNAEMAAEEVADWLRGRGWAVELMSMNGLTADAFRPGTWLICTSTHGLGDVPDDALDFFEDVQKRQPDLSGCRVGVFCLGDSVYETFCGAGKQFWALMQQCGADLRGEMGVHDASTGDLAEDVALEWVQTWVNTL